MNQKKAKRLRKLVNDVGYDNTIRYFRNDEKEGMSEISLGYLQRIFVEESQGKQRKGDILKEESIVPFVYGTIECHPDSQHGKYRRMKKYYTKIK